MRRSGCLVLGLALSMAGCDGGSSSSSDDGTPAAPSASFAVARAFFGGGGSTSLTSTAATPTIGRASASLGQANAVGVVGGMAEPTLLAGIWPTAANYQLLSSAAAPSPAVAWDSGSDESLVPPPGSADVASALTAGGSGGSTSDFDSGAAPSTRSAGSELSSSTVSEPANAPAATPGVPLLGAISRLLLVGGLLAGGLAAGRSSPGRERRRRSPEGDH
jgi:hypothetical protein